MKLRQWATIGALFLLLVLACVAFIITGESDESLPGKRPVASTQTPLVDGAPLHTARSLAELAITPEEQRLAQEAARVADHEVDLAFADALSEAAENAEDKDPKYREMYSRIRSAQATLDAEKARSEQLQAKLAAAKPDAREDIQEQIDLLDAQIAPDEGDLEDAKHDLIEAGGDREGAIERQRAAHEANEDRLEKNPPQPARPTIDLGAGDLAGQVRAWTWLKNKRERLQSALDAVQDLGKMLAAKRDDLVRHIQSEASERHEARQQVAGVQEKVSRGAASKAAAAAAVESLKHFSTDQKLLSGYNKQIQDQRELSDIYRNWIGTTAGQQRAALHAALRSALWILLIVFLVYLGSRLIDRFFTGVTAEKKRLFTLRAVARFAVQVVGVLLIALVVFGAPSQTPTVLGLAGAGLTVALKDFIVAFFGWFVLMGRNGMRVGDWVEINGVVGEVIEIGLLRTVLLETGNWTDTGHPTGRKVAFVNSFAIEGHFFNFSTTGQWLWDELQVLMPQGQNPYQFVTSIEKMLEDETRADAALAEQEWGRSAGRQRVGQLSAAPAIHLRPTTAGVEMQVRYITSAHERFAKRARMYEKIVRLLHGEAKPEETANRVIG
jgi:small-conductance mechanosensitive channel